MVNLFYCFYFVSCIQLFFALFAFYQSNNSLIVSLVYIQVVVSLSLFYQVLIISLAHVCLYFSSLYYIDTNILKPIVLVIYGI